MTDASPAGLPAPEDARSIPWDLPLHGPPPARFRDGEVLAVHDRTTPGGVAALVPAPLAPLGDTVLIQVARWGDVPGPGRDTHEVRGDLIKNVNCKVVPQIDGSPGVLEGYSWSRDFSLVGGAVLHDDTAAAQAGPAADA